tara:strand:+ start:810 stop:1673 length:864 start_codon:yes stop_codon:yes gene_type:complete
LANTNFKKIFNEFSKKIREFDFNVLQENFRNFKIEDLKNINISRLIYDIRNSKYTKPVLGFSTASVLTILFLIPNIILVNKSFRKVRQYKNESINLESKIELLKIKKTKFEEINLIMNSINKSFLKKEDTIFIANLINQAAKKSNIRIQSFSPILNSDTANLCKVSTSQKNSKQFTKQKKKLSKSKKGSLLNKYYELTFSSDYMDSVQFLREIQDYDVMLSIYCLEVQSAQLSLLSDINTADDSVIIPLNSFGYPIGSLEENKKINNSQNLGDVITRIILLIPSYSR